MKIIMFLLAFALVGCKGCGPKTYEFSYSVDVKYADASRETLVGTQIITTDEPEKITFTMSSRLRMNPCLTLGRNGMNIACGVKSFQVNVLKHREVDRE